MTIENNWKYIAEAWIDNKEEEEFKKSFLNALIEQIQGHEKGFDADTVDGKHWWEITQEIERATEDLLSDFYIGNTFFSNSLNIIKYFLGFEAIKLYNIEADGTPDERKQLPWSSIIYDDEEGREIPDLYDVIEQLYKLTYFGDILTEEEIEALSPEQKEDLGSAPYLNKSIYKLFLNTLNEHGDYIQYIRDTIGTKIVNGLLNADSVNGLRFFILSQEQYDDLKEKADIFAKAEVDGYEEYENCYKKLYNIHNIFIIRTEEELIFAGYPDGRYTGNPDTVILDKYYKFRVGEGVEEGHEGNYLQYQHEDNDGLWFDMCPTSDFLDQEYVDAEIINVLNNNDNYLLNPEVVRKALRQITPITDNTTDIPMVNYGREKFLAGGVYDYISDSNKKDIPIITNNKGLKYLNLTNLNNSLKEGTNTVQTNLNNYKNQISGPTGELNSIRGSISQANDLINSIKGGSNSSIQECCDRLDIIEEKLSTFLDETYPNYKNLFKWENLYKTEEWIQGNYSQNGNVSIYINRGLRLAKVSVNTVIDKDNAWKGIYQIPIKKFQPIWTTYLTPRQFDLRVRVVDDEGILDGGTKKHHGTIQYYSKMGAKTNNAKNIEAIGYYIMRGGWI